jgi:hypothetical protein
MAQGFQFQTGVDYFIVAQEYFDPNGGITYEVWVNGVLLDTKIVGTDDSNSNWAYQSAGDTTRSLCIGGAMGSSGAVVAPFSGSIGHFAYFNRGLSWDEISTVYSARSL